MSSLYFDRMVEQLYDLDRRQLRQLAREAALLADGPDRIAGNAEPDEAVAQLAADEVTRAARQPAPADLDHMTAAELAAISEVKSLPGRPLPGGGTTGGRSYIDLPYALDDSGRLTDIEDQPVTVVEPHDRRDGRACLWVGCRTTEPHGWCPDRCQEPRPETTGGGTS